MAKTATATKTRNNKTAKANTPVTGNVVKRDKYSYKTSDVKTASGKRKSIDNDDALSKAMRGMDRKAIGKVLSMNGLGDRVEKHVHLNDGMFRMVSGQALRAMIKRGEPVKIDNKTTITKL